jgi:hypothetical protein
LILIRQKPQWNAKQLKELLEINETILNFVNNLIDALAHQMQEGVKDLFRDKVAVDNEFGHYIFPVILVDFDVFDFL